ncbi:hypothetical protein L596_014825 [Steinernema carpocapsae]|uniref:DUF4211 domain-containing protein n=1 Tax=Steinernema carpocapsae TaxID=34508 RepID=A0A4U5NE88_STECR|nr:hypothetical protein L596_014825 [Steinernema carpocapsae]
MEGDVYFPEDEMHVVVDKLYSIRMDSSREEEEKAEDSDENLELRKRKKLTITKATRRKMIFGWYQEELQDKLRDYVYFHFMMVFDRQIEACYSKEAPSHRYLKALDDISKFNEFLVNNLRRRVFVDPDVARAIAHHSVTWEDRCVESASGSCKLCEKGATYELYFQGPSYNKNSLKIDPDSLQERERFFLCPGHREAVSCYFALFHMRWNVYHNCVYRVRTILSEDPSLSASEVIDTVNPRVIDLLVAMFLQFYRQAQELNHGFQHWRRFVKEPQFKAK